MSHRVFLGLAAGMGLLMSPDHLRLWGNLAGQIGPGFLIVAFGAAALYALSVTSYRRLAFFAADADGYLVALRLHGGLFAVALALTSRLALAIGVSTGILVASGFVFNETFVYWFPNFAFAFLYLAFVALVHFLGYGLAEKTQSVLLGITLLALVVLVVTGFWQMGPDPVPDASAPSGLTLRAAATGLLLFVGFDLGVHRSKQARDTGSGTMVMLAILGLTVILLSLWGLVSLEHVPAKRLADSFIPYTLAARKIGGQTGRILAGIVVIAGTGCAVISLFSATARMVNSLARLDMLPKFCRGSARRGGFPIFVLATAVAALMAAGFAGDPDLEVFIRAGFLLWLLHVVMVNLAAFKTRDPNDFAATDAWTGHRSWVGVPAALLLGAGAVYLWITDTERMLLLTYMLTVWSGGGLLLFLVHLKNNRKTPPAAS